MFSGSPSSTPAPAPQLSLRKINQANVSPTRRQIKNYDMNELENRNGGLGWVGPIYGNKTHSSKRYASPLIEERNQAAAIIKHLPQSFAAKKRRESTVALEELYPDAGPDVRSRRSPSQRSSPSPEKHDSRTTRTSNTRPSKRIPNSRNSAGVPKKVSKSSNITKESPLLLEQMRLLKLLQDNIRAEEGSISRRGSKRHTGNVDAHGRSQRDRRQKVGRHSTSQHSGHAATSRAEIDHHDSSKRHRHPILHASRRPFGFSESMEETDTSSSDASVLSGSRTSSSDSADAFVQSNPYRDDRSISSLDSGSERERHDPAHFHRNNSEKTRCMKAEDRRGSDRHSRKSTNRVRYPESSSRPASRSAAYGQGNASAQVRYNSPTNATSTVAAARAGISHNFFELYGGKPGGVRVPEKVKISSMLDKSTPIRNPSDLHYSRRRLASPTVSSGRRFHTPELDRVHSRRGVSADSYSRDTGSGLTDAAEWSRLTEWLGRLKLQKYAGLFRRSGITKLSLVELLRGHDLAEIGIDLNDHQRILQSIQDFSRRTISFAEEALSPHEERLPQSNHHVEKHQHKGQSDRESVLSGSGRRLNSSGGSRPHVERNSGEYITSRDVLRGDLRPGAVYRPMTTEDLLKLGSPEAAVTGAGKEAPRHSKSQEVKSSMPSPPLRVRMTHSGETVNSTKQGPPSDIGAVLSSTPTGSRRQALTNPRPPNPVIDATLLSLNKAFWVGDEALFYKIWDAVASDLTEPKDVAPSVVQAAHLLELFSRVYFVTWPQRSAVSGRDDSMAQARTRFRSYVDNILANPDTYSVLLKSREFATFVGIGMLPDAASNAAYASLFKSEWADGLARRLNSFLSNVMTASAPTPAPSKAGNNRFQESAEVILGGALPKDNGPEAEMSDGEVVLGSPGKAELSGVKHTAGEESDDKSDSSSESETDVMDEVGESQNSTHVAASISLVSTPQDTMLAVPIREDTAVASPYKGTSTTTPLVVESAEKTNNISSSEYNLKADETSVEPQRAASLSSVFGKLNCNDSAPSDIGIVLNDEQIENTEKSEAIAKQETIAEKEDLGDSIDAPMIEDDISSTTATVVDVANSTTDQPDSLLAEVISETEGLANDRKDAGVNIDELCLDATRREQVNDTDGNQNGDENDKTEDMFDSDPTTNILPVSAANSAAQSSGSKKKRRKSKK